MVLCSSQKLYKEKYEAEKGKASYTNMKTLPDVEHAMEVNKKQSEVITHHAAELYSQKMWPVPSASYYPINTCELDIRFWLQGLVNKLGQWPAQLALKSSTDYNRSSFIHSVFWFKGIVIHYI